MKKRPIITKRGAPGGWGIWSLYALETNSPQSQKLPVGSIVITYTVQAITPTIQPTILFTRLKLIKKINGANIRVSGKAYLTNTF